MNKEAPRTEEWIDRHGRRVLLNRQERQTQHQNWSAPNQIQRKKPETPVKPTRIRLNYEPNAGKSAHRTLGTHEQQSIWEIPVQDIFARPPIRFPGLRGQVRR
jgi:hypothetical protein